MSATKGFPSEQKSIQIADKSKISEKYTTINPIGAGRHATDVMPKALYPLQALSYVPEAGTTTSLQFTGHSFRIGDVVRFTAGSYVGMEVSIVKVDVNNIYFGHKLPTILTSSDECVIARPITLTIDQNGNLATSTGPIQFVKDSLVTQVIEDTVDSNNNVPLPVKLTGITGDINITAGDLNVQTSHAGANPDSIRVGDGTNLLGVNSDLEALVHDVEVHNKLDTLNGKDFATQTTLAAILAKIIAAPSTEAKQDSTITQLTTIAGKDFATQTTLAAILAKIIAAPATEAKQDNVITQLTSIASKDFATQTTLAAILAKIIAAPATEAKQDTIITALGNILAKDSETKEVLASYFSASSTIPTATRLGTATVPASTTGLEVEVIFNGGDPFAVYDAATSGNLLGYMTQAGNRLPINLAAGTSIYLQSLTGSNITASNLIVNIIGV